MGQVTSHISGIFGGDQTNKTNTSNDSKSSNHVPVKKTDKSNDSSFLSFGILATPRNPLKRVRQQLSPTFAVPQSILDIFSPSKKARIEDEYLNFTFLDEKETVEYYKKSKIMIILRGLPGSGKSTIAKHVQQKYVSSRICSADYFFMKNGEYVYDRSLIKEAHVQCQENTIKAVQDQVSVIIIDNTNLKQWEMKFYLDLAKAFNYIPVIAEPKTPWRRDVSVLVSKTVHNLDESILELKKNDFEDLLPMYYGWFLNEKDTFLFLDEARMWIETVGQIPEFMKEFKKYSGFKSLKDLLKYYEPSEQGNLHCTANYIGKHLTSDNKNFIEKCETLLGNAFEIDVVGFVLTPRTFGARINLSKEQLLVWGKDDNEKLPEDFWDIPFEDENEAQNSDAENDEEHDSLLNGSNGYESLVNGKEFKEPDFSIVEKANESLNSNIQDSLEPIKPNHINGINGDDNTNLNSSVGGTASSLSSLNITPDPECNETNGSKHDSLPCLDKSWEVTSSPKKQIGHSPNKRSPRKQKSGVIIPENAITIDQTVTKDTISLQASGISDKDKFAPTKGLGSRAHLTLGCGPGVKPVTTGLDMIFAIQKESKSIKGENDLSDDKQSNGNLEENSRVYHESAVEGAIIRNYGNGVWVIYLDETIRVKSVFSARY